MSSYERLFQIGGPSFHVVRVTAASNEDLIRVLERELPPKCYLAIVDLARASDLDELHRAFAEGFRFPDYFGYNWDALEECLNDLSWLDARSYILVLENTDRLTADRHSWHVLLGILLDTAEGWMKGRDYNRDFPTPPTPFHIVLVVGQRRVDEVVKSLEGEGMRTVDILESGTAD